MRSRAAGIDVELVQSPGTPSTWGGNGFGELGDGTTTSRRTTPVPGPGLAGVETVTAGRACSAAL
jgi:hypothetical protein